jgi:hypothetical protein
MWEWLLERYARFALRLILVAGVSACILTAVVILPAILKLIIRYRAAKGVEENA